MKKMTEKQDKQMDRRMGIKEGSKRDIAQDKKHGVMPMHKKPAKEKARGR